MTNDLAVASHVKSAMNARARASETLASKTGEWIRLSMRSWPRCG